MEQYILLYLLPVLTVITIALIVVVFAYHRSHAKIGRNVANATSDVRYTKKAIDHVSTGLDGISNKIDTALIPTLDKVYEHVQASGYGLVGAEILKGLHDQGLDTAEFATTNESVVAAGVEVDGTKITYFIQPDSENNQLIFLSFCISTTQPNSHFMESLLMLNARLRVGNIGFRKLQDEYIVMANYTINASDGKVKGKELDSVIHVLIRVHEDIKRLAEESNVDFKEMLASEYARLSNESRQRNLENLSQDNNQES